MLAAEAAEKAAAEEEIRAAEEAKKSENLNEPDTPDDAARAAEEQPAEEPNPGQEYVVNTNSGKFHYPTCSSVDQMKPKNRWDYTGTRDELIEMGYQPCKRCNP